MSMEQAKTLEERYDYIRRESVPLSERWPNPPGVVQPLLQRLEALGVALLADHPKWDKVSIRTLRLGLASIVPGRQTVIWVNFVRHYVPGTRDIIVPELIDTIAHEAIHTTGTLLQRFVLQPEDPATLEYMEEEVCALAGTSALHGSMGSASAATAMKRAAQKEASKLPSVAVRRAAIERGNEAARFLLVAGAAAPQ